MSSGRKRDRRSPTGNARAREGTDASNATGRDVRGRAGPLGSAIFSSGPSVLPPVGRSLARGFVAVASQPVLILTAIVLVAVTWFGLIALGFEGSPGRLVDVLAMPPISTYFDLGTGASFYGVGPTFLLFTGVAILVRALVYSVLMGVIVESIESGRVTGYGVIRGLQAIPTTLVVSILSFSLIVAGNLVFPILGPGIGFLGFVAALVAGLFLLGFAPAAAIREGRTVTESIRRSGRAAMLPGGRHLLLCTLYFFLALPVVVGFAPSGTEITANPSLGTWVFVLIANAIHLSFMAAFAYRWIVAEPEVPEEPVRRRQPPRAVAARQRGRR